MRIVPEVMCAAALAVTSCARVVTPEPERAESEPAEAATFGESEPSTPLPEPRLSGLVVGGWGGCVYIDRTKLWCWGAGLRHRYTDLPAHEAVAVEDGRLELGRHDHCRVRDGKLECTHKQQTGPRPAIDIDDVVEVEEFNDGVCVRTRAGQVACPGGQLPSRLDPEDATLKLIPGITDITELELDHLHGCMTNRAGRVQCFGENGWGQLGAGDTQPREQLVDVNLPGAAIELAVSRYQSCAIVADDVLCWGAYDVWGDERPHFGAHEFEFETTALHAEGGFSCATRPDGSLWCWGSGRTIPFDSWGGAVRAATPTDAAIPWPVTEFNTEGILSGDEFILARSHWPFWARIHDVRSRIRGVAGFATDGLFLTCVYGGTAGLRCLDTEPETVAPARGVPALRHVSDMTINSYSMCAVHGGRVSCLADRGSPWVRIPGLHQVRSIVDDGDERACALTDGGRISCWRGEADEQGRYRIDDGPYELGEHDVVEIAWGWELLARSKSGALRSGQPSEGAQLETLIDTGVLELAGAPEGIWVGGHACARVDRDGDGWSERIACFGDDRVGQLGRLGEHVRLRPRAIRFLE
jgi:hypothetical protein